MTQDQLSKIINFTPAAISAWENGVRYPGPDAQLGIYNALGLNAPPHGLYFVEAIYPDSREEPQ